MDRALDDTRLAPGLLLAMPQLVDANFTRAVVLMIEHNDDGSFGLVINQPGESLTSELLDAMQIEWNGDPNERVWSGGPVMPTSGWLLHGGTAGKPSEALGDSTEAVELVPGLCLSTSADQLRTIAAAPPDRVRLILGYSGWGPGQLASEMARGSWLPIDATPELVFDTKAAEADTIWETAIRTLGIDPEALVQSRGIN